MKTIKIYTSPNCTYCKRAKELFASRGLGFEEIDITKDIAKAGKLFQKFGKISPLPVILIGSQVFFGFSRQKLEEALK